jgi:hypothetical protein
VIIMMKEIQWTVHEVIYMEGDSVVVSASDCPKAAKLSKVMEDGTKGIVHVKAMNALAKKAFKDKKIAYRATDAEGEEADNTKAVREEEASERTKKKAEAKEEKNKDKQEIVKQVALLTAANAGAQRRTRPSTGSTPQRAVKQRDGDEEMLGNIPPLPAISSTV